ncbi:MAG: hypothetical protein DI535_16250 [Citrobacter freundii]|nr:MAG: hypothetical protein DI535_16250 [Citrobacter freundii]
MQLFAQPEKLGTIEVFGSANASFADIIKATGYKEGDSIVRQRYDKAAIEKRIRSIPGIVAADVTLVCCDDKQQRSILYIGVSDAAVSHNAYHDTPAGDVKLDPYILAVYDRYDVALDDAVRAGQAAENDEEGHVLLSYPPIIPLQDSLQLYAASHLSILKQVLRGAADPAQRQAASWIIAFTTDKKTVVEDLLYATDDADETVRNNATRALAVLARYTDLHPSSGIVIPAAPFIRKLNSFIWTDRNKGLMVLEALTRKRDDKVLQLIRTDGLLPIIQMARWKNPGHAMFSLMILGRIAGISDDAIFAAYNADDRNVLIDEWIQKISNR